MSKYRKRPVVIEAIKLLASDYDTKAGKRHWRRTVLDRFFGHVRVYRRFLRKGFWVLTLEGWLRASYGDWIITGVQGEHYPCKPDIFEATYEKVGLVPEQVTGMVIPSIGAVPMSPTISVIEAPDDGTR